VDLHISTEEKDGLLTVRVAGRLRAIGLEELRRACREGARVRLDLSDLITADEAGTTLLAALRDSGTELVGVPPYIDLLLRARLEPTP
jgi:anti-anti-sigma regulatory factor